MYIPILKSKLNSSNFQLETHLFLAPLQCCFLTTIVTLLLKLFFCKNLYITFLLLAKHTLPSYGWQIHLKFDVRVSRESLGFSHVQICAGTLQRIFYMALSFPSSWRTHTSKMAPEKFLQSNPKDIISKYDGIEKKSHQHRPLMSKSQTKKCVVHCT